MAFQQIVLEDIISTESLRIYNISQAVLSGSDDVSHTLLAAAPVSLYIYLCRVNYPQ